MRSNSAFDTYNSMVRQLKQLSRHQLRTIKFLFFRKFQNSFVQFTINLRLQ